MVFGIRRAEVLLPLPLFVLDVGKAPDFAAPGRAALVSETDFLELQAASSKSLPIRIPFSPFLSSPVHKGKYPLRAYARDEYRPSSHTFNFDNEIIFA